MLARDCPFALFIFIYLCVYVYVRGGDQGARRVSGS